MTLDELRVLRIVQAILVRNYINTQRLEVQVIGTTVYMDGDLEVFEYHPGQKSPDRIERDMETARSILHVEKEMRTISEVTHIEWKLRNWQRMGNRWVRKHLT